MISFPSPVVSGLELNKMVSSYGERLNIKGFTSMPSRPKYTRQMTEPNWWESLLLPSIMKTHTHKLIKHKNYWHISLYQYGFSFRNNFRRYTFPIVLFFWFHPLASRLRLNMIWANPLAQFWGFIIAVKSWALTLNQALSWIILKSHHLILLPFTYFF